MQYLKHDMEFTHYRWIEGDESASLFTGEPSRRTFDPFNGKQVLFLINYCMSLIGKYSVETARILECRIAYKLPFEQKSERTVFNWLTQDEAVS
jgi:hypothetical protein